MQMKTILINIEKETLCARIYICVFVLFLLLFVAQNKILIVLYFVSFNCINDCWEEYVTRYDSNSNVLNNNESELYNVKKSGLIFLWCDRWK